MTPLLSIEDLSIEVATAAGPREAVTGFCLTVAAGEIVGLVGESGAGKSLTALSVIGLLPPGARTSAGRVLFDGIDLLTQPAADLRRVRGARIGMIFQEPMSALNPSLSIGYQIAEPLRLHRGLDRERARAQAVRLLEKVAVSGGRRRLEDYPHQLSGGQRQRVMIAMALASEPELLLADEPTTALDVTVQAGVLDLLGELSRELGLAVLFISHDLAVVSQICDRISVLYAGREVETGTVDEVVHHGAHPYTRALVRAVLGHSRDGRLSGLAGRMPEPGLAPTGCAFRPRCAEAFEPCADSEPELEPVGGAQRARCFLHGSPPAQSGDES